MPAVHTGYGGRFGLWDVAVHPRFEENGLVYFTYLKPDPDETVPLEADARPELSGTSVLARGRFDGDHALADVEDIFVSNRPGPTGSVSRD